MKKLTFALASAAALCATQALAGEAPAAKANKKDPKLEKAIKRGEYLVNANGGCGDCHSPKTMTPEGPVEDVSRRLSGHPAEPRLPPPPKLPPGPWAVVVSGDLTAWSGPWGITYTRNLTPDKETGIGDWTEQNFVDTLKTGKRMGKGRPLMPPMPIPVIKNMTDEDLKAIYAYLMSLPPIKNAVPEPELAPPPGAAPAAAPAKDAGAAPAPAKK